MAGVDFLRGLTCAGALVQPNLVARRTDTLITAVVVDTLVAAPALVLLTLVDIWSTDDMTLS